MSDCFISYRRTPSAPVATALQSKLESRYGFDVYVDTTRTDGTQVRFPERLMQAIEDAPVFICLLGEREGQHTLESDWVLKEIQRAFELQKFCIPVFQESYRPLPNIPPAVDYLLGFDGVHYFDVKNVMIDDSVRQIADLIRPQRKKRRRLLLAGVAALIVIVAVVISVLIALSNVSIVPTPTTNFQPTTAVAQVATQTPTDSATDAPSETPTATLPIAFVVATLDAQATEQQATVNVEATAAARLTEYGVGTQSSVNATATATLWTKTPTPDITASIEVYRTQQGETATQARVDSWTDTPTPTLTPTLSPEQIALTLVAGNADWTPHERDFEGVTMMLVPAGCFMMGSNDSNIEAQPVHEICFDAPFWIDKTEVTNAAYGSTNCADYSSAPNQPRNCVDWFGARDHCAVRGVRLPSEAEWEYAARGPDGLVYPWGNEFVADNAVFGGGLDGKTESVGSRPGGASWVGTLDMSGNVWEWTRSLYEAYPYDASDGRERDTGNSTDVLFVLRGGSFYDSSDSLRAANRFGNPPGVGTFYGFRCVHDFE